MGAELSRATLALERAGGVQSLPTRLRPQAGSGLRDAGTPGTRSQSIWERIERLYGSEKAEDSNPRTKRYSAPIEDWPLSELDGSGAFAQRRKSTTDFIPNSSPISQWRSGSCEGGGGFPKRLFREEKNGVDTAQSPQGVTPSGSSVSGRERAPGAEWQGQAQRKPPELGQIAQRRGVLEYNTRSLDRARAKLSVAAPSRADRSAYTPSPPPSAEDPSRALRNPSISPPPGDREERVGERRNKELTNNGERKGGMGREGEGVGERTGSPACRRDLEKEATSTSEPAGVNLGSKLLSTNQMNSRATPDPSTRTLACVRSMAHEESMTEDVFEPSPQRSTAQPSDRRMLVVPSVASVKNKIQQFETLTQKNQRDFQRPRRAFSVPEHLGRKAGEGASKAGRGQDLGGRRGLWEGVKEERDGADSGGERMRGPTGNEVKKSAPDKALGGLPGRGEEEKEKVKERGWAVRSASVDETGLRLERREREEKEREDERREKEREAKREAERRETQREAERREKEREAERREKEREAEREAERRETQREAEIREKEREAERREKEREAEGGRVQERGQTEESEVGPSTCPKLKDKMEIHLSGGIRERPRRASPVDETSSSRPAEPERPIRLQGRSRRKEAASIKLLNFNNNSNSTEIAELQHSPSPDLSSSVSDNDKTPTNTPQDSPFYPQDDSPFHPQEDSPFHPQEDSPFYPGGGSPAFTPPAQPHTSSQETNSHLLRGSLVPPLPLSSPSSLPHTGGDLDAWVAGLNRKIERWDCDEEDDEGTEKDEDSNYDSDESSVTITSNMSQSDRRSFCLSLAELCNFGGVDYETEPEMEDWPPGRSASLSSDVSALSCVSVLDSEELDRLLDDVRSLGDDTLQNYEDVQVVVLHKEVGIGLGFTVAGGEDQNKPVTVHRVFSSGVAALEGSIREGDLVLSINGTSLSGSAHWQALRTLRKARTLGMGVVVLRRGVASKPVKGLTGADMQGRKQTPSTNTGQRLCVRLEKGSRDLGFTLEGGLGCSLGDRPLSVQKIFLGGPVNKVCPGDEVLEIQGVSVVGMRRLEAWTLIRRLPPGPVDVLLHRPLNTSHIHSQSL